MCRKIVYQLPPAELIEAYTQQICRYFAEANEAFNQNEVIWGFTEFVKIISAINARELNEITEANAECADS